MMNYPEARPLKRMPMAHIVTVTGKSHLKNGDFSGFKQKPSQIGSSAIQALICKFCLFYILCFPIRKLSIVFPNDRGGKTKFGVNLSFAAKFGRRVKATEVESSLRMSPD